MENFTNLPIRIQSIYNTCSSEEQYYLRRILQELADTGYSYTYESLWLSDYSEIPVDIDTFIKDPMYLGKATRNGEAIYPYWYKVYHDIYDNGNKYDEIILTGATRIGKTSTGITALAYLLYRMMCLRDPQEFFHKKDVSKFSILFFNLNLDLARGVAYREFNDTICSSPWFMEHGKKSKSDRNFYYIPDGDKIIIDYGSDASHSLGQQIFGGFMDEVNFRKAGVKDINKAKASMQELYNSVSARIKGTFRQQGEVWGKLFAISSKNSDSDFMETYVKQQIAADEFGHIYVSDKPQWEVLPPSMFHREKFFIAVGDRHHKGFVVPDNQSSEADIQSLKDQGYQILNPPVDMRPEFVADFDIALRDLAGISVPGALSFITQEILTACIDTTRRNPFHQDILEIGTKDSYTIEEFFHMEDVTSNIKNCDLFIHLDLSLVTDRTGISGVGITGRKDIEMEDGHKMSLPYLSHAFSIALQAPRGDKISYSKIVEFLVWLRRKGFRIHTISRDQFQSEYVAQILEEQNFHTDKISLDRTPDGYITLRSIFLENRIDLLDVKLLQDELIRLQRDSLTGKVDHEIGNSKDLSDSLAGAVFEAVKSSPGVKLPGSQIASVMSAVNGRRSYFPNSKDLSSRMFPGYKKF